MKRLSFKSITLMCCMALSFGACQDIVTYNDNYDDEMASSGAPVIDAVYDSKDRDKLLPITDGNLEQMIVLDGSNLSRVRKVMLNFLSVRYMRLPAVPIFPFPVRFRWK